MLILCKKIDWKCQIVGIGGKRRNLSWLRNESESFLELCDQEILK